MLSSGINVNVMNEECAGRLIDRALSFQNSGNLHRAGLIYRGLLRRNVCSARLFTNYGVMQYRAGKESDGIHFFEIALESDPSYQDAWHNLYVDADLTSGDALLRISTKILGLFPDTQQAWVAQVKGHIVNSNYALAKKAAALGLEADPDDLTLRELIARCDLALGDIDSALVHLLYILSLNPTNVFASMEMSDIAAKSGDFDSVISILETAYKGNPKDYSLMLKIARTYQSGGFLHKAIDMYVAALAQYPDSPTLMGSMAYCYAEMGLVAKLFELFDRIIQQSVEIPENLIPLIFTCSTLGDEYLERLREYSLLFWSLRSKIDNSQASKASAYLSTMERDPVLCHPGPLSKVRLGILTGDLGAHVVSSFLASFLLNYSKDSIEVEIISNQWRNDQIADVLSRTANKCYSIADYGEIAARDLLHSRNYDIIIETSGFTSGSAIHLLAERCAPIQCHWIGYHASTYMPTMDYFLGDSVLTPESHSNHFTEQIVRLERAWLAATPFTLIPEACGRNPDADIVIGSFSQIAKLTDHTLRLWANVLAAAPHAKLLLKDRFTNDLLMKKRILAFFESQGVASDRISFMQRSTDWFEHMKLYNMIDLAVDTTPWSSATTAFDALSMGLPLVGLRGKTTSGLMSSSVLSHCGKADWIAENDEEFTDKCLEIINNVQQHRKQKRDFQSEILKSQLFDGSGMAQAIEKFILHR